jgi:hypothetical protein
MKSRIIRIVEAIFGVETTDIDHEIHNIRKGLILQVYQSSRKWRHDPRIRIFNRNNQKYYYLVNLVLRPYKITIASRPKKRFLSEKEENDLLSHISKYRDPYIKMSYDALMTQKYLESEIRKIDARIMTVLEPVFQAIRSPNPDRDRNSIVDAGLEHPWGSVGIADDVPHFGFRDC